MLFHQKTKNSPLEGQVVVTQCDLIITSSAVGCQIPWFHCGSNGENAENKKDVVCSIPKLKTELVSF